MCSYLSCKPSEQALPLLHCEEETEHRSNEHWKQGFYPLYVKRFESELHLVLKAVAIIMKVLTYTNLFCTCFWSFNVCSFLWGAETLKQYMLHKQVRWWRASLLCYLHRQSLADQLLLVDGKCITLPEMLPRHPVCNNARAFFAGP